MNDCIFCKIAKGEIPSTSVYSDEYVYAFRDINPQTDTHILVIPRAHIESAANITPENSVETSRCFEAIAKIAAQEGLTEKGFRVISNSGTGAGQSVFHLHFHILSGPGLGERLI
ncbi:MAG: histidine triad nucleotide-binding protein [Oscillospiraceae bacterium]|jgi:histidine triad (HIT) family protein|nr:histidine triad nucleotide-binding protein [Oscillospiraceae bacterium]